VSLPNLPDVPRERRRTATVVAVGVFGVLCVLALVLGLRGLFAPADGEPASATASPSGAARQGSGSPSPASGNGSASASATASPSEASDLAGFSSPSGNIHCEISSAQARCDIAAHTWQAPPKPADCEGDWGQGLQVSAAGAGFVCASDSAAGGPPLAYGASIERGDLRCDSDKDGVTCVHRPSGHTFSLARATYAAH
jgi:hypothetical protein